MEFTKARQIFRNIKSDRYTAEEKGEAIYRVMKAETINSISKGEIMNVVRWLFFRCFDLEIEGQQEVKSVQSKNNR